MQPSSPLTAKDERFIEEYLLRFDAFEAAAHSGICLEPADKPRGYYVYFLVNPASAEIFYVGKGKGKRAKAHVVEARSAQIHGNPRKLRAIREIVDRGEAVGEYVLRDGLTEDAAYALEREYIAALKYYLTNDSCGQTTEEERVREYARQELRNAIPFEEWWNRRGMPGDDACIMYYMLVDTWVNMAGLESERDRLFAGVDEEELEILRRKAEAKHPGLGRNAMQTTRKFSVTVKGQPAQPDEVDNGSAI